MDAHAPYDARAVANFLLDLGDARKLPVTQLFLYKILYFAHGWYLAKSGKPLITQDFEAWEYGPVVKILRDQFRKFGKGTIKTRAEKLDIFLDKRTIVEPRLTQDDKEFIQSVFSAYQIYHAWELSEMTHEAGSPWDKIWNSSEPIARLGLRLTNAEIKAHFDSLPKRLLVS
jgi:uncharacterized phage-associated protein